MLQTEIGALGEMKNWIVSSLQRVLILDPLSVRVPLEPRSRTDENVKQLMGSLNVMAIGSP